MRLPLRVIFVIQKLAGLPGGAERVVIDTARGLTALGHRVEILSYDPKGGAPAYDPGPVALHSLFPKAGSQTAAEPLGYGLRSRAERFIKFIPNLPPITHLKWAVTHGLFASRLRRRLRLSRPDVVVAFLPPAITATAWALKGLPKGRRPAFVASTHNLPGADFDDDSPRWDQNPLYRRRARAALAAAQAITILQPEFARWFPPALQERLVVMPNMVRRLTPVAPAAVQRPRENLILAVGRLTSVKRHDLVIEAFSRVADRLTGWQVLIHGEGAERPRLEAQISALGLGGRVHLPGVTDQIGTCYDRAAILCHPARFEGFGLSVAEAMIHGLAVVAYADCPGVNQLVQHGVDGLLLPGGDDPVTPLAGALVQLAEDQGLRQRLGTAAEGLATRFAPDHVAQLWAETLQRVAQAAPGTRD